MATNLGDWRKYFKSCNSDIFDIIENAIVVAASDYPKEFRDRRDQIAELLFTCRLTQCNGCDNVELKVAENGDDKPNNSNLSCDEVELLTGKIEEETEINNEILRIKEVLSNPQDESDKVLFESLRRLQLMELSIEILETTKVGRVVNVLRKHGSKPVRQLAQTLITGWKILAEEWVAARDAAEDSKGSRDSVKPSEGNRGLPSPPSDEGAFFVPPTSIEFSQFFDGIDDDGNPQNHGAFNMNNKKQVCGTKPVCENRNSSMPKPQRQHPRQGGNVIKNENRRPQIRKRELMVEGTKTPKSHLGGRKESMDQNDNIAMGLQQKSSRCLDEAAVQLKLDVSKRKLHESYQQVDDAKKKRKIQVMELHDLPKQGRGRRNSHLRHAGQNRNRFNGRA